MATRLLDGLVTPVSTPPPTGGGNIPAGLYSQASVQPVGTAPLTGVHNQSLHIAIWGLGALGIIVFMHKQGFRLVSVGRYGGR